MSYYKKEGCRDPSSHRTPAQIKKMDRGYNATPEMERRRGLQNKARAMLMHEGLVHKGDNKDVDHKKMLDKGGGNSRSNLRVVTEHFNRSWKKRV
jgi:5-methylcytosine-specific restriction endonuclease McrA